MFYVQSTRNRKYRKYPTVSILVPYSSQSFFMLCHTLKDEANADGGECFAAWIYIRAAKSYVYFFRVKHHVLLRL